jgi:hypothetical protein
MKQSHRSLLAPLASLGLLALAAGCTLPQSAAVQSPDSQGYGYGGGAAVARQAWGSQPVNASGGANPGGGNSGGWGQSGSADPMAGWNANNPNAPAQPNGWPSGAQPNPQLQQVRPDTSTQWTPGLQSGRSTQARQQAWGQAAPDPGYGQGSPSHTGYAEGADSLRAELGSPWDRPSAAGANPALNSFEAGSIGQIDPSRRTLGNGGHAGTQLFDELQQVRSDRDQLMEEVQFLSQALLDAQNRLLTSEQSANRGGHELQLAQSQVLQLQQQLARAQADNEELATRLYQAQIGRLKAERTLLEDRIGRDALGAGISLQPGQAAGSGQPAYDPAAQNSPTQNPAMQPGAGYGTQSSGGSSIPAGIDRSGSYPPVGGAPTQPQTSPFARPGAGFGDASQGTAGQGTAAPGANGQIPPPIGSRIGGL